MGCEASKLYRRKDRVKSKVTLLLSWRRRCHSSISKQMLLNPGSEDGSTNDRESNTLSYREPADDSIQTARIAAESIEPAREGDSKGNGDDVEAHHESVDKESLAMENLTLEEKDDKKEGCTSLSFLGSPSFRYYLTDDNKEEDCSSKDELAMEGWLGDADFFGPRTPSEEVGSKIKKSGRRGMRFRRAIPPVKNFLKAKCR